MVTGKFDFGMKRTRFCEDYLPSGDTRVTTNFANLARGESRQENLRNVLTMINNRLNDLARWDNPQGDRYAIELDIVSIEIDLGGDQRAFPMIEMLETSIIDRRERVSIPGIVGNNFSSYVRDYDFSIRLPDHNNNGRMGGSLPEDFGNFHGRLFKRLLASSLYKQNFRKAPVICLSVSTSKTYQRTANRHPVLGVEYMQEQPSLTDLYFGKMGMKSRYFLPENGRAPLAYYFVGDLLNDYTSLELIATIGTMETFQRIYRPEIYNANSVAAECFSPNLVNDDYSLTRIVYDREERSRLAVEQGRFAEHNFITPHRAALERWLG